MNGSPLGKAPASLRRRKSPLPRAVSNGSCERASRPIYTRRPRAERCRSGRTGRSRKPLWAQVHPGFESLSLRHTTLPGAFSCPWKKGAFRTGNPPVVPLPARIRHARGRAGRPSERAARSLSTASVRIARPFRAIPNSPQRSEHPFFRSRLYRIRLLRPVRPLKWQAPDSRRKEVSLFVIISSSRFSRLVSGRHDLI